MSNEITAYFKGTTGVAESVYQHDYGMIMNIDGLTLLSTFDVHFEISGSASTVTAIGSNNRVAIPNDCLAVPGKLTAYIYTHTGSHDGETAFVVRLQVINRARPDDDITDATEENNAKAIVRLQTEHEEDVERIEERIGTDEAAHSADVSRIDAEANALKGRVTTAEGDIDSLEAQFTTVVSAVTTDTEVTNIRVGDDRVTYSTAGEAVRNQLSDVKNILFNLDLDKDVQWTYGYIRTNTTTVDPTDIHPNTENKFFCAVIDCKAGDLFTIAGTGGTGPQLFCFLDSSNVPLLYGTNESIAVNKIELMAPLNAVKLVVNIDARYFGMFHKGTDSDIHAEADISSYELEFTNGFGIINTNIAGYITPATDENLAMAAFAVNNTKQLRLTSYSGGGYRAYNFFDKEWNLLDVAPTQTMITDQIIRVPQGSAWCVVQCANYLTYGSVLKCEVMNRNYIESVVDSIGSGVLSVGSNILNSDVWEAGGFNYDGSETASDRIRIKAASAIPIDDVDGIRSLSDSYKVQVHLYDANNNYIGHFYNGLITKGTDFEWKSSYNIADLCSALKGSGAVLRVAVNTSSLAAGNEIAFNTLADSLPSAFDNIDERFDTLSEDYVPTYWKSLLDSKAVDINTFIGATFFTYIDAFMFITDIHYPEYSYDGYGRLIKYIQDHTPVTKVFVGGDLIQSTTNATAKYGDIINEFSFTDKMFATIGNHDAGFNLFYLTQKRQENYLVREYEDRYYVDSSTQKIRYIVISSGNPDSGGITTDQKNWCKERINELVDGWRYVILTHGLWIAAEPPFESLEHTADYDRIISILDDCQNAPAKLICVISGHCHTDYEETTSSGYLLIGTTCEANGYMAHFDRGDASIRTPGTTTEHAFDCFVINRYTHIINVVRIGAGSNRTYSYV